MLTRLEVAFRTMRRKLSRNHWLMHWFKLPPHDAQSSLDVKSDPGTENAGLILVQIDGLGLIELQNAINSGEAPFMAKLLQREQYQCHSMYSGLPSSTPAVQGELFYGVKTVVPAFGFKPHDQAIMARMYEPDTAKLIEKKLDNEHVPLLAGGSAYCNIYTGGAAESHFCASSLGWDDVLTNISPVQWLLACLLNLTTVVKTAFFMLVEACLACIDFLRGQLEGRLFFPELKFIAARMGISVLLRDIVTVSACVDIERGLPVIQLNYIGYDEQSHRRGPDSKFAHWTIRGIDRCIEKLWHCAHRTDTRHYDLWVYSDHGQEATTPFIKLSGQSIDEVVSTAFEKVTDSLALNGNLKKAGGSSRPSVIAMGPVGHVYLNSNADDHTMRIALAKQLVLEHDVPAAVVVTPDDKLVVYSDSEEYDPTQQGTQIFGTDHPYAHAIAEDLHLLCTHIDAGDIVLLGWINGKPTLSFSAENGGHAGLGPKETEAFALLPADVFVDKSTFGSFRPLSLRQAAIQHLHASAHALSNQRHRTIGDVEADKLKVMSDHLPLVATLALRAN